MMGCGKSTVGPLLAKRLSRPFLDSDAEIERRAGKRIAEIFAAYGEAHFRKLEREVIEDSAPAGKGEGAVVALGGGAIAQPGAAERLRELGTVVYLRAQPKALLARIGNPSSRPLLADLSPAERASKLGALLREREPSYLSATIVVDCDVGGVSAVVREVAERLKACEASGSDQANG
jgi:shikimate kinase